MDMVSIAKRENNIKRKYLVVNKLQGKHIPVSGTTALKVFDSLAEKLQDCYSNEKLLIVGFAETATAIGAELAAHLKCQYIQTTREIIENVEFLYFTESHSHATEQKLVKNDIDTAINSVDRIVFAEDEITTGNTIVKIADIIEKLYPKKVRFAAASLLNGMNEDSIQNYKNKNIDIHYLVKTSHDTYTAIADSFKGDGIYSYKNTQCCNTSVTAITDGYLNTRRLVNGEDYTNACSRFFEEIKSRTELSGIDTIAVIGTEEFMYPALYTASRFEQLGKTVFTHSTTRSPISVSSEEDYPLHRRFELASLYDGSRKTFIYDLKKYDCVIILTDSICTDMTGINTLVNALKSVGNDKIYVYRWCSNE